jgi:hypothetical protein
VSGHLLSQAAGDLTAWPWDYRRRRAIIFRSCGVVRSVNRFTLATWPLWYFLGMRGLTILFVTFAALLVMRGQQQPHFALRPTAPIPAVNVP